MAVRVPWARSLKDRRQVAQSLLSQIGRELPVAVADLSTDEDPRLLVIGLATVGNRRQHVEELATASIGRIERAGFEVWTLEIGER